ncbi:MAG: flagellar basal-body rod protein FlgG [Phycisphaerales bacterium]|nr:flagellar basal-body rod protein FlgG [Phycisphaerales bacterium]
MAIIALQSASSGLNALNTKLDVIANNLANINTEGYKASRANFQDLLYIERAQPGVENPNGDQRPTGLYVGLGVKVSGTQQDFTQGAPITTGQETDLMIEGRGFFQVQVENELGGGVAYTRAGNFTLNADGDLVLANDQGRRLEPNINIPPEATKIDISTDGRVFYLMSGETEPQEAGQIQTASFVNPAGLRQVGENLWVESIASGPPSQGNPGEDDRGRIRQGMLEASNVDPARELIELIRTQRAFEMNSQSIRAADQALQSIAQLRR